MEIETRYGANFEVKTNTEARAESDIRISLVPCDYLLDPLNSDPSHCCRYIISIISSVSRILMPSY